MVFMRKTEFSRKCHARSFRPDIYAKGRDEKRRKRYNLGSYHIESMHQDWEIDNTSATTGGVYYLYIYILLVLSASRLSRISLHPQINPSASSWITPQTLKLVSVNKACMHASSVLLLVRQYPCVPLTFPSFTPSPRIGLKKYFTSYDLLTCYS